MKRKETILLTLLLNTLVRGSRYDKCCKQNYQFIEMNTTFICVDISRTRLQINSENDDFLNKTSSGNCMEVFAKKINIFSFDNSIKNISRKENVLGKYFPKCCPLGSDYNEIIHACAEKKYGDNLPEFLLENSFVKIGLPHCDIISDHIFDSTSDVKIDDKGLVFVKTKKRILDGKYCIDSTLSGKFVMRKCEENKKICEQIRCVRKCCPDGKSYTDGWNCLDTFKYGLNLNFSSKIENPNAPFAIIHGISGSIYLIPEDEYNSTGIFPWNINKIVSNKNYLRLNERYCVEYYDREGDKDNYFFFGKTISLPLEIKFIVTRWMKIISCIFLILTISVYLILPKMRNLFAKILLSYSIATFFNFLCLCITQFYYNVLNDAECQFIGFSSILANILSFTWLNIMCIDIWFSFGAPRTLTGPLQKNEFKRLLQYSLYGWGFPIFWVLMIFVFETTRMLPEVIHPYVGVNKCYLENYDSKPGNYAYFLYIVLPILIQQIINTILFVKTVMYCLQIKAEIQRLNDTERKSNLNIGKERLGLIIKLAVIMGVSFVFETVSSIYNFENTTVTTYIEVVWDSVNCLQGLFIFIIFICKKKIYNNLCEKVPIVNSWKSSVSSTPSTQVSKYQFGGNEIKKTP